MTIKLYIRKWHTLIIWIVQNYSTLNSRIAVAVSLILIAGAMLLPLSMSTARAEDECPVTDNQVICVFDLNKGDVKAKELKIGPFNINGGNGVDQVARDAVEANGVADGKTLTKVDGIASNVTALQGLVAEVQQLRADVNALNQSALTDIDLSVGGGTGGGGNNTGNGSGGVEPPVEPPIVNGTGTNSTGNTTGNLTG